MSELRDIKISGSGDISGGEYNNVRISGSGDILGDLICNELVISGSGDCNGKVRAKKIKISGSGDIYKDAYAEEEIIGDGSCEFKGNVNSKRVKLRGSGDVLGDITAEEVEISGSCDVKGNVKFDSMSIRGSADIYGDCEGRIFSSIGSGDIKGLLSADEINIDLTHSKYIKEIGGEKINVVEASKNIYFGFKLFKRESILTSEIIEGDEINLENTTCKIVRGRDVIIGKNCSIGKVEYTGKIIIDKSSEIKEVIDLSKNK